MNTWKPYIIVTIWAVAMVLLSLTGNGAMKGEHPALILGIWGFWWVVGCGVVWVWRRTKGTGRATPK